MTLTREPVPATPRKAMGHCSIDGCDKRARTPNGSICEMHYGRFRRNGSFEPRALKLFSIKSNGYVVVRAPNHPLTKKRASKYEYQHRIAYFDAHGEGPFPCYWCKREVTWSTLHIDHVDGNKTRNDICNLVASCPTCNQARGRPAMRATMRERYGLPITHDGETLCLGQWAERIGISRPALNFRLENGWSLERALTEPRGKTGPKAGAK